MTSVWVLDTPNTGCVVCINRQSPVKSPDIKRKTINNIKDPNRNVGNSKRSKVQSSLKGKLGRVHSRNVTTTHVHSEQNSLKRAQTDKQTDRQTYSLTPYTQIFI